MIEGYDIPIPKNRQLTKTFVRDNVDQIKKTMEFYVRYPDIFIDHITPKFQHFGLFFYQRIFLRASLRYRYHYCVAPRAFSKSFTSVMAGILRCVFLPNSKFFICAPHKEQAAKIANEKINEILETFPMLRNELVKINQGKDYITLLFKNNSRFDVVGAFNSERGGRKSAGIIDEVRDHDGDQIASIVLPFMNVNRKMANGLMDQNEPHQAQIYITSAGGKGTYAYEKLLEVYAQMVLRPHSAFVWGCDYHIPMMHGLIDKNYIEELSWSSTYKVDDFTREYLSRFTGGSSESWINYDDMSKYRKIVNAERKQKLVLNDDSFYLISVDVARHGVNTSVFVFKVVPKATHFEKRLVFLTTFKQEHFSIQSIEIKKLYEAFKPREIIIDGTGLGSGLLDFLVMEQIGEDGRVYAPLASFNDKEYNKYKGDKVIYVLKAAADLNSEIHNTCFSQLSNGHVRFLIREQEAKAKLMSTKRGQKMKPLEKRLKLAPYYQTTKLFEETANLRVKLSGKNTVVEQINRRVLKDRFSALEYGLWRIKFHEENYFKKKRMGQRKLSKFVFFN